MKIHFIPGLGADERVFGKLNLPEVEMIHIKWLEPLYNESLIQYCKRLILQIDRSEPVVLAGMSFGGIIAQEIAKLIPCEKILILSSVTSPKQYSFPMFIIKTLKIYKLFNPKMLKEGFKMLAGYYCSVKNTNDARLLATIISETTETLLHWSVSKIMEWKNEKPSLTPLIQIHGIGDRIFPHSYTSNNAYTIKDTGHFMIVDSANIVSKTIRQETYHLNTLLKAS